LPAEAAPLPLPLPLPLLPEAVVDLPIDRAIDVDLLVDVGSLDLLVDGDFPVHASVSTAILLLLRAVVFSVVAVVVVAVAVGFGAMGELDAGVGEPSNTLLAVGAADADGVNVLAVDEGRGGVRSG
jgi:hypothetical protein